jgi:uncharacterized DUF497 family protein
VLRCEIQRGATLGFPDYFGVKNSFSFRKAHAKAVRLYTTSEVAHVLKLHKMVLLRWIARGEVKHPAYYCAQHGLSLLWSKRELNAVRIVAARKKRRKESPYRRS